ncbi:MAG TPA: adenylate/guanylate cyclase domain-containing protein, partial [Fimbriimonas sp.]|nr:adenylate/guanylate cyclase domain-containing protein [Fimbriimonas sp.]
AIVLILSESQTLQTIVLTDVVGYTEKMRLDEPGTLRQLRHDLDVLRTEFEKEGGSIIKVVGDGVYALFPSCPAALRAALACQTQLVGSSLVHRTAVHVGEVTQSKGDIHGDAVNVCARIEAYCPPGAVCASRVVLDMVGSQGLPSPTHIKRVTLKGLPAPIEIATWGGNVKRSKVGPILSGVAVSVAMVAIAWSQKPGAGVVATNDLKSFPALSKPGVKSDRTEAEIVENWMDQAFDELWQEIEEYDTVKAAAVASLDADSVIKWLEANPLGQRERGKRELEHWKLAKAAVDYGKRKAGSGANREAILKAIEDNRAEEFGIARTALLEEIEKYK